MKYQLCPWIIRRGVDRLIHCTEVVPHCVHSTWENGKRIAWTEYAPGAYEIGARKMAEPKPTGGGATSETMRKVATFLDTLTELSRDSGVHIVNGTATIDHEGVDLRIYWSTPDEAYLADLG